MTYLNNKKTIPNITNLTNADINRMLFKIISDILVDEFNPELIIGISRGGLIPGVMLSHYFNVPFQALHWNTRDHLSKESNIWLAEKASMGKRILIIDDMLDTGTTIKEIIADWNSLVSIPINWYESTRIAALNVRYTNSEKYNYTSDFLSDDTWIAYPWETWSEK